MIQRAQLIKFQLGFKHILYIFIVIIGATYLIFRLTLMASIVFLETPEVYSSNDPLISSNSSLKVRNSTLFELATSYFHRGETKSAIFGYRRYIQSYPDDVLAMLNLSSILIRQSGKSKEAYALAQKALNLRPEEPICQLRLGESLIAEKKYRAALKILKKSATQQRNPDVAYKAELHIDRIRNQGLNMGYLGWIKKLIRGDLGKSAVTQQPIKDDFFPRLKNTLLLVGGALAFSILGILLGIFTAQNPSFFTAKISIKISTFFLYAFSGIPTFIVGYIASEIFRRLHSHQNPFLYFGLMMSSLAIGSGIMSQLFKNTKSSLSEILAKDYIRTAKAKGVGLFKHWGKNLIVPVMTDMVSIIPVLLGGTIIIEMLFNYDGIGIWILHAAEQKDLPVLMITITAMVIIVCIVSILRDMLHIYIDPRLVSDEVEKSKDNK